MFIYHLLWTCVLGPAVPVGWLFGKPRLRARMGLTLPAEPLPAGSFWIHALSVGEVLSALPLVDALRERHPDRQIVFTATTTKGMAIAHDRLQGLTGALLTMPVDFWWSMRRMIRHVRPAVFVLVETDIWPGLLGLLRQEGIRSLLVNGRISPGSFRAYRTAPWVARQTYGRLDRCLMQTDLDRERLLRVGGDAGRVFTVGNIKFDRDWPEMDPPERARYRDLLQLPPERPVWVAGSTHAGEERLVLEAFRGVRQKHEAFLILAPRHIDRGAEILAECERMGFRTALRTAIPPNPQHPQDVLVLDTLGELARVYALADVSFVGGSLVPAGGHNLLEPAGFGRPVLFGPHTENFTDMARSLQDCGGGKRVRDGRALGNAVEALLSRKTERERMGNAARGFVMQNRGATAAALAHIEACLEGV